MISTDTYKNGHFSKRCAVVFQPNKNACGKPETPKVELGGTNQYTEIAFVLISMSFYICEKVLIYFICIE